MKSLIIILVVFCFACSQKVPDQELVLRELINSQTTNGFFKEKGKIPLIANKHCIWKPGKIIKVGKKKIKIVSPDSLNHQKALEFAKYQVPDGIIDVEIYLFRQNVLFQGKYRKQKDSLRELSSNIIFSKTPTE